MKQTGATEEERRRFLQYMYRHAVNILIHKWDVEQIGEEVF